MADNMNDKELDLGKRPVFELNIPKDMIFVFGVDAVYAYDDSTVLAGEIFRGQVRPGTIVSYGEIGPKHIPVESFACYISNIQVPNEQTKTMEPVQHADKNGAMGARYAMVITGREAKFFKPGGVLFARKMEA